MGDGGGMDMEMGMKRLIGICIGIRKGIGIGMERYGDIVWLSWRVWRMGGEDRIRHIDTYSGGNGNKDVDRK